MWYGWVMSHLNGSFMSHVDLACRIWNIFQKSLLPLLYRHVTFEWIIHVTWISRFSWMETTSHACHVIKSFHWMGRSCHIRMSHVASKFLVEPHRCRCFVLMSHIHKSFVSRNWVMSLNESFILRTSHVTSLRTSHVTLNDSFMLRTSHVTSEFFFAPRRCRCCTVTSYMNESFVSRIWVMSHMNGLFMSHMDAACRIWQAFLNSSLLLLCSHVTYGWVIRDTSACRLIKACFLSHTDEPCRTWKGFHNLAVALAAAAATHVNTLQHMSKHYNTLRHTSIHCSTLRHTATHCNTFHDSAAALAAATTM